MNHLDQSVIKQHTIDWIRSFIIEYNICPFAKHVVEQNSLLIKVSSVTEQKRALSALMAAIGQLEEDKKIETTLLIFPFLFSCFFDYLDFVTLAEDWLLEQDYEGVYQLATFHPDYCFAGVEKNDVSNYTNRSPYPMVHLLREHSIEKAIAYYGDTTQIPDNNITLMHQLGLETIKKICK